MSQFVLGDLCVDEYSGIIIRVSVLLSFLHKVPVPKVLLTQSSSVYSGPFLCSFVGSTKSKLDQVGKDTNM